MILGLTIHRAQGHCWHSTDENNEEESEKDKAKQGMEEHWRNDHNELERQSQSYGHGNVDANKTVGHHAGAEIWCVLLSLLL